MKPRRPGSVKPDTQVLSSVYSDLRISKPPYACILCVCVEAQSASPPPRAFKIKIAAQRMGTVCSACASSAPGWPAHACTQASKLLAFGRHGASKADSHNAWRKRERASCSPRPRTLRLVTSSRLRRASFFQFRQLVSYTTFQLAGELLRRMDRQGSRHLRDSMFRDCSSRTTIERSKAFPCRIRRLSNLKDEFDNCANLKCRGGSPNYCGG